MTEATLDIEVEEILRALMRTAPPLHEDCVIITSLQDGRHSSASLHYVGRATDVRITGQRIGGIMGSADTVMPAADAWVKRLKQQLGPDYDVINERNHIHIEWDPKR